MLLVLCLVGMTLVGGLALHWVFSEIDKRRWRRPARFGFCETCGYNLHGLPEARCPECGTLFEQS